MLLFSTLLEINDTMTKDSFIQLVLEWNQGSPHEENIIQGIEWNGERNVRYGTETLWLAIEEYRNENIIAVRYEKTEADGVVWDTDYVMNFNDMRMSIQLDRSYLEEALAVDPTFSTPHFITLLIEHGYLKDDGILPMLRKPIFIKADNVDLLTDVINGTSRYRLPVVYISKTYYGEDPVDIWKLSGRLKGVAHVLVEEGTWLNERIRRQCDNKNEFNGAIGVYFPNSAYGHKKYLYRAYDGKDNERPCHFIGSVIYLAKQDAMHASAVKEYLVIDGQQRLTTISIVLLALGDYTRAKIVDDADYNKATTSLEKLSRRYLTNEDETGDTYYKVRLNEEDFYAWMKLLENRTKPDDIKRSKIFENYGIIYKALCDSNVEPQLVYDGIKKLRLVDICLVPEDNAQLVFETVNSTGLPLSTADKIRNFLLMTVEPSKQTKLYLEYWHPMEKALGMESGESSQFESFFNYYMTSVLQRQLVGDYYDVFKNYYYENKAAGTEGIVKQIHQYSKYYTEWNTASDKGTRIQRALFKVRKTGQFKITPAILKLLSDRNDGLIADDDVVEILTIMESYWMRRAICALPTNTAGPVCISMLKSLNATNQLKSFKANLFSLTWAQRMPSDTEIKDTLKTLKIYSLSSSRTKTILDKLENNRRKEYVPTSEYTIEHIMPQTLSDDWKSDLGADANRIHETYVHTIGNLTLTGYNSEYQNKRFSDKVDCTDKAGNAIGYRHTPIKISSYLTTVSKWGEDEILARAEMLSDELITIWKYPKKD